MSPADTWFALSVTSLVLGMFICFFTLLFLVISLLVLRRFLGRLDVETHKSQTSTLRVTSRSTSRRTSMTVRLTDCLASEPPEHPGTATL